MLHLHSFLCVFKKKQTNLKLSYSRLIFWPTGFLENNTPVSVYTWRQLLLNVTLLFLGPSHLLMIPFMFTSLNHPRKLYSSSTLCHTSPCSLNCPNHTTCESDPKGDKCRVFPSLIIPMKNQTWAFYPHKILLPNILDWYLENKFWIFFSSKMADEKYFLFVSLCFGFHLNLKTFLK